MVVVMKGDSDGGETCGDGGRTCGDGAGMCGDGGGECGGSHEKVTCEGRQRS